MWDLKGSVAPLVTPFTDSGTGLSEVRLARLIHWLMAKGVEGLLLNTEIGEFTSTSFSERKTVLEIAFREARGNAQILQHITTLNSAASLDLAQHAQRHGARAVVVMPPYYGSYTPDEHIAHIKTIHQYCDLPIILVDPDHKLCANTRQAMGQFERVILAQPFESIWPEGPMISHTTQSYEWVAGSAVCSPLAAIFGHLHRQMDVAALKTWSLSMQDLGVTRLMKQAYSGLIDEMGPCRSPYLPLSMPKANVVQALVLLAKAKEKAAGSPAA